MSEIDLTQLRGWIGRSQTHAVELSHTPLLGLAETLDQSPPTLQEPLPLPAHWLYFLPRARQSELSDDGHPRHGDFMPPVPLPRRMWAGSEIVQHRPIHLDGLLQRTDRIDDVSHKRGTTGDLIFVRVHQTVSQDAESVLEETQTIVFRQPAQPGGNSSAPSPQALPEASFTRECVPDERLLFRFSALTFNAHRIHYDAPYARDVEGYPALVVHGPLSVMLLTDLLRRQRPGCDIQRLSIRALKPLFANRAVQLCGAEDPHASGKFQLWTVDADGEMTMRVTAQCAL